MSDAKIIYPKYNPDATEKALLDIIDKYEPRIEREIEKFLSDALSEESYITEAEIARRQKDIDDLLKQAGRDIQKWEDTQLKTYYDSYAEEADNEMKAARIKLDETLISGAKTLHDRAFRNLRMEFESHIADSFGIVARKSNDLFRRVQMAAALQGFSESDNIKAVVKDIKRQLNQRGISGFVDKRGRVWSLNNYSDMAARTVTAQARIRAKEMEFLAHGEDLVITSDHYPTCEKCLPWGNKVLSLTGSTPGYPTLEDAKAAGFLHPRCFPAGVIVSGPAVLAHDTRWYEGKLITLKFSSGDELSCTPNHPILTPKGWVAAGSLNVGNKVAQYVGSQRRVKTGDIVDPDNVQIPTRIEDIPSSLFESGKVTTISVPVAAEDFHGDGFNGKVDIVRTEYQNTILADAETDSDLLGRLSGKIKFLDVVDRNISDFAGHVYNLQTEQGWYIGNNIITHNCRHGISLYTPEMAEWFGITETTDEEAREKNEQALATAEERKDSALEEERAKRRERYWAKKAVESSLNTPVSLKGTEYTPEYRRELLDLDKTLRENGMKSSEHALNRLAGRLKSTKEKYAMPGIDEVIDVFRNGESYIDPGHGYVKLKNNIAVHLAKDGTIKTFTRVKKVKDKWQKQ
jgi:hypothetical protein